MFHFSGRIYILPVFFWVTMSSANKTIVRVTLIGMLVNILLSILKMFLGIIGNSSALVADAFHSLSDIISDVAVLVGVKFWSAPADIDHPHGHKKIEIVTSFFIGVLLFFVGIGIVYRAVIDIQGADKAPPNLVTLVAAGLSIILKEVLYRWTAFHGIKLKSSALIANAWHHRSDAISSLPVLFSILIASIFPKLGVVDVIGAVIVSGFIFQAAYKIMREAFDTLIDASAPPEIVEKIKFIILEYPEVHGYHNLRTRYLGSSAISVDFHMEVEPMMPVHRADRIAHEVEDKLIAQIDEVVDVVIHLDPITPVVDF